MRPSPLQALAPRLQSRRVNDWRLFLDPVCRARQLFIKQLGDVGKTSPVEKYLSDKNIRAEVFRQIEATSATQSKKYKERYGVYIHSLVVY